MALPSSPSSRLSLSLDYSIIKALSLIKLPPLLLFLSMAPPWSFINNTNTWSQHQAAAPPPLIIKVYLQGYVEGQD